MFHKEGYKIIAITFLFIAISAVLADKFVVALWLKYVIFFALFVILFLILQFFRNPKRNTVLNDNTVVSLNILKKKDYK